MFDNISSLSLQTFQTYQTNVDPTLTTWQTVPGHGLAYKAVTLPKLLKEWRSWNSGGPSLIIGESIQILPKWTVKSSWSSSYIITSCLWGWATVENSEICRRVFSSNLFALQKKQKTIQGVRSTYHQLELCKVCLFSRGRRIPPKENRTISVGFWILKKRPANSSMITAKNGWD